MPGDPTEASGLAETTTVFDYNPLSFLCESRILLLASTSTAILYSLVFLLSLAGNSLVLWVLVKYENLETFTNLFILNLCLSDLLFSCLLPVWISAHHWGWVFGDVCCKLFNLLFSVSLYSSIFFLALMTIHRYLSVSRPLSLLGVRALRWRVLVIAVVWAASVVSSIPDALFHEVSPSWRCDYSETRAFLASVYQHNVFFAFSTGIVVFCNVQILKTLLRSRSKPRHRTVRLVLTIVAVYFLSWAPYNLVLFLQTLVKIGVIQGCGVTQQLELAVLVCRNLAFSHCCFNPVLYVFVGVKFRRHLKRLLRQIGQCRRRTPSPGPFPHSPGAFVYEGPSFY
ncbi:chemokine XC receptor 1 [Perognathus longimembris pacificus]|uniref:chemokine XC receptor 1 n=1 Tax=Perognathus longimembris pacificus TaxID=214514 RepID=UPI002019D331|nr:chemokine XC receptor 1 [Perognathus longimembris pacificus]